MIAAPVTKRYALFRYGPGLEEGEEDVEVAARSIEKRYPLFRYSPGLEEGEPETE